MKRDEPNAMNGPQMEVIEFGASWCGICQAARPLVAAMRAEFPDVAYRWEEDGKGVKLGRMFGVKLWPTLVFLRDGNEVARVVRPRRIEELREAMGRMSVTADDGSE